VGSSLTTECDSVLYTHAGPEIGVAATKTFTTHLVALFLFALYTLDISLFDLSILSPTNPTVNHSSFP
jgi:glucosamine 6-phosphate synthetase-like amidotransferase/phosphosugar isomerase protein